METTLAEIERALNVGGLYYLAVSMALTLPDVCAALESPDGKTSKQKYKTWYDTNLSHKYSSITAEDCYSLRCGVSHQGRLGHPNLQYERILFTIPNSGHIVLHNNIINDALNLDSAIFCRDAMDSVRIWLNANQSNPIVQNNLPLLMQYRPQGLHPYIVGIPLIS